MQSRIATPPRPSTSPKRRKGGRPRTGEVHWMACVARPGKCHHVDGDVHWHARARLPSGRRPFVPLDPRIPYENVAAAKAAALEVAVEIEATAATDSPAQTVKEYAKGWLADREGRVNSIRDDRSRLRDHVLPTVGHLDASTFTRDDVEQVRDVLDAKIANGELAWKTAASVWTLVTRMCSDMVDAKNRSLRVRKDNPCTNVRAPERGADKAKQFLFPSEFLKFVSCESVPLRWRRAVALAVYLGLRDAELRILRWEDVDLAHGVVSITRAYNRRTGKVGSTKTGETRRFEIHPNMLLLMQAIQRAAKGKGLVIRLPSERAMARNLRRWLWKVGVRRPELHERTPTSNQLRWHDLRATTATWMAVGNDAPLAIKRVLGHRRFETTEIYIRQADAVRGGFGEVFPPLPACLLGLGGGSLARVWPVAKPTVPIWLKTSASGRGGRDSNPRPPA
jgi:integrase